MIKQCTKCLEIKDISFFRKKNNKFNKLKAQCKSCLCEANKIYNNNHIEKIKKNNKNSYERIKYHLQRRYNNLKCRTSNIDLTFAEYSQIFDNNTVCYYCNQPFKTVGSGLDRLDNNKGYTKNNVVPCCGICNLIRGKYLTPEEMKIAMQAIIKYRKENNIPEKHNHNYISKEKSVTR